VTTEVTLLRFACNARHPHVAIYYRRRRRHHHRHLNFYSWQNATVNVVTVLDMDWILS